MKFFNGIRFLKCEKDENFFFKFKKYGLLSNRQVKTTGVLAKFLFGVFNT